MKGIILAGGSGSRLHPVTKIISKQLLPIYDKPMIYYPLSILMLAKVNEILIITTSEDNENFKKLLGDGSQWGLKLTYDIQKKPGGIAQALLIAEKFVNGDNSILILGDNLFFGNDFPALIKSAIKDNIGASIFAYPVNDPERYGVIEFDKDEKPISIKEKPINPKSNFAITGLYLYDKEVFNIARKLKPSKRGELEISSVNEIYLKKKKLNVHTMSRGMAWLDTGTHDSLLEAAQFVQIIQKRQGLNISSPEEIAFNNKWINKKKLEKIAKSQVNTIYGKYLLNLLKNNKS